MQKLKHIFKHIAVSSIISLWALNASALPSILGTMEMTGGFHAIDVNGDVVTANTATGIDFDFFSFDMFRVTAADGDFSSLVGGLGSITDFQFDPFLAPIPDFWTIDIYAFELTDVARGFTNDPVNFLVLDGFGVLSASGFENTSASWSFTGDTSGNGIFSWSATSANVPEPSHLLLLATGLIGFGLRKKFEN